MVPPVVRTLSGSTAVLQSLVGETASSLWCGKKKKKKERKSFSKVTLFAETVISVFISFSNEELSALDT